MLSTVRMARRLARAMLAAVFLLGYTPMLAVVANVPVALAKPQHEVPACSPSPSENCHAVDESIMADCDGMPRQADRTRCSKAAIKTLYECLKKQDFQGGGGRF
jgi:hypothetical protein